MKITVAMDSFKGSLSSLEAGEAVRDGIMRAMPDADVFVSPLADGGEGTAYALTTGMDGNWVNTVVTGPLGRKVTVSYGVVTKNETKTAIMEIAEAAGLTLLTDDERNPLNTTTYGVGEMICDAVKRGCRRFLIGLGGSATNDGGIGMLQALGFDMFDKNGEQVLRCGEGLRDLERISDLNVLPELKDCVFHVACDVSSPLCGKRGSSAVFAPQKGADEAMARDMDSWLAGYAKLARRYSDRADPEMPGAGAAGGLGFAFMAFLNAKLEPGCDIVIRETGLEKHLRESEILVTGEGRLDKQTVMGKAPSAAAKLAKKFGCTVIALAGSVDDREPICEKSDIDSCFPVLRQPATLEECMDPETAMKNIRASAEQVFRLVKACRRRE